ADRTLFPHAFGLRTPAPLWTAAAFDSCLLLALIYPFATILIIWAASGDVGPAEAALLLKSNLPEWQRGLVVAIVAIMVFAILRSVRMKGWIAAIWFVSANPTEGLPTAKAIAIATIIISVLAGVVAANGYAIELAELAGVAIVGLIVLKAVRFVALG